MGLFRSFTTVVAILGLATVSLAQTTINTSIKSTILIFARDAGVAASATSGLNGYGIPYEVVLVPQSGITLPVLNTTAGGNYGGIIVEGQVSYDFGGGNYQSALTTDQWNQLYAYQTTYGVRMVQFDVYPQPAFGTTVVNGGGCCAAGVEQLFTFTNTAAFSQAGIKANAGVSTQGLWHYNAQVTDTTTTTEIAQFGAGGGFPISTAAVINNFSGRQQMVFFISWATAWSPTSNFLQHAYITYLTRGVYTGYRRVNFVTQVDDMFLETELYTDPNTTYRVNTNDMKTIAAWVPTIQAKMNTGSIYYPEIGHNGNGNVDDAAAINWDTCAPGPIFYDWPGDTALEFQKPLGTGTNKWPTTPTTYQISTTCIRLDPLEVWFATVANRDKFFHISHTHTHLALNNATYSDALKEIQFNQAWFRQTTIGGNTRTFSPAGLIPPAITGLHNGDVLRAWKDAGLTHAVGDNSRPVLRNTANQMWPYTTTVADNGFAGYTVIPRWATRIYYNCDTAACTLSEWINTSAGTGDFQNLLNTEKADTIRHLMGLYHDGYMFHQANFRTDGLQPITYNGITAKISIFQVWVETIVQEFTRLVNWPLITIKQDDLAASFRNRQARDACAPKMSYTVTNSQITAVTISANGNSCGVPIPFTLPGTVKSTTGLTSEKIGNDPQTYWATLSGSAKTYSLTTPVAL
jgi:hypothetical protein